MMTINLYLTYLGNSVLGMSKSDKLSKLTYERSRILEIINGIDSLFVNDPHILDRKNRSIYSIIKRDILKEISMVQNMDAGISSCKVQLMDVLGKIDSKIVAVGA